MENSQTKLHFQPKNFKNPKQMSNIPKKYLNIPTKDAILNLSFQIILKEKETSQ
jgi:hypothetical protein